MEKRAAITWEAVEHHHAERGSDWYWALGIVAVSTALTALLFGNFLFALLIVVAAGTMALVAMREPKVVEFALTDRGIRADDVLYPFKSINAFWVDQTEEEGHVLFVDTARITNPDLIVPLGEAVDPEDVREFLLAHDIPEVEMQEPVSHRLLEFFGF